MDWSILPYNHTNKWKNDFDSIMNPGLKCSWPQLLMQWVIQHRVKYIKSMPKIIKGPGWSKQISQQVRILMIQAAVICNYFPRPEEDPLVVQAFQNYFKKNRVFTLGGYRKYRVTKTGKLTITQGEKDIVKGVMYEYESLKRREIKREGQAVDVIIDEPVIYKSQNSSSKNSINKLLDIENSIREKNG